MYFYLLLNSLLYTMFPPGFPKFCSQQWDGHTFDHQNLISLISSQSGHLNLKEIPSRHHWEIRIHRNQTDKP